MGDHVHHNGCGDHQATRRALFSRAADAVPIPADAMDGLESFEKSGGLDRKDLLERGVGLWVGASMLAGLSTRSLLEAAVAQAADDPNAPIFVSLYLDGGNDGLNTLVPLKDPKYPELRSRVGIDRAATLPLNDTDEFGWNPACAGLQRLYDAGKVAVLPSVDYAEPDLSHFNSYRYWWTGVPGADGVRTGWLGRTLDAMGNYANPLQGVSVSWGFDPILTAKKAPTATVYDPDDFDFWVPGVWGNGYEEPFRQAIKGRHKSKAVSAMRAGYRTTFGVKDRLDPIQTPEGTEPPPTPEAYPDSELGNAMKNLGRMLGAGLGIQVAALSSEGRFDTHDSQEAEHTRLIGDLSDSLSAFQADIEARGLGNRVVTLVWSEFGRRPQDNESAGTDHGAGGLCLLVGNKANGGIRSEFPGLSVLDRDDNLRVTTEFPHLYATILEGHLGVEAARVLPGIDARRLPIFR